MAYLEHRPSGTLYQYCSQEGFFGITRSKRLWFSDLAEANDPREIELGFEKFIEALKSVRHDEYSGERGIFLSILASKLAPYRKNIHAFCACFSQAPDELPMWSAYASSYTGLAIGFRPTALLGISGRVQKVRYLNDNTAADFRRMVLDVAQDLDRAPPAIDTDYWIPASVSVFAAVTALKHQSWSYEREVRMIHIQTKKPTEGVPTGMLPDGTETHWTEPLVRQVDGRPISYLEFPFGQYRDGAYDPRRAIKDVIIGPKCTLTELEVRDWLERCGFEDVVVRQSTCAVR
ncbi:DUF2971 domain-containing protein [Enterovirga aerilata]|uniref:DUF2971 domain-containing protein n=1 Tax=Enterovirga aerilata TaxID=2730920 RepID=A0A849HZV9_9HYPH|nr:DUF2971 domain-containing protein [Enterovirga sp. DB1703]NNM73056.1 DUF2971 domain-containing protein [Enterovirga sp. DB1703]